MTEPHRCSDCGEALNASPMLNCRSPGVQYDRDVPWLCRKCDEKRAGQMVTA